MLRARDLRQKLIKPAEVTHVRDRIDICDRDKEGNRTNGFSPEIDVRARLLYKRDSITDQLPIN